MGQLINVKFSNGTFENGELSSRAVFSLGYPFLGMCASSVEKYWEFARTSADCNIGTLANFRARARTLLRNSVTYFT